MNKKLPSNKFDGVTSSVLLPRLVFFLLAFTAVSTLSFAQLQLLKDINTSEEHSYNEYSMLTHGQGRMYFVVNGNELWKSNGTPESSIRLRTFKSISNLKMAGTTLYFAADDGTSGVELWKSNGTAGTTVRVKDIIAGAGSSAPHNLTNVNGILYFAASSGTVGVELWKSDGTSSGTVMVKDLAPGSSNPRSMVNANGVLYFTATTAATGYELWRSDGTSANTILVKDVTAGKQSSDPQQLTYFNGKIYFTAYDPATGRELWSSEGTGAGTTRVKDIRPGSQSSTPRNLTVVGSKIMFSAHDGVHGDELWKTDGTATGTVLVKDMNPGGAGSNATNALKTPMRDFTNANGILYFVAAKGATEYIYRSDGTASGTFIIQQARNNSYEIFQPSFTYMNGYMYFFNSTYYAEDQNLLRMPYKGTAAEVSTVAIIGKPYSWVDEVPVRNEMIHFYNNLYFFGRYKLNEYNDYDYGGYEFIRSDGTYEGTKGVVDAFVTTESGTPQQMIRAGKYVYMYVYGPLSYSPPLYVTDGTPEGTIELISETTPVTWTAVGDQLYVVYGPYDGSDTWVLARFNGAESVELASGEEIWGPTMPSNLKAIGNMLYFSNELGQVWKTDGTPEGTVPVHYLASASDIHQVGSNTLIISSADGYARIMKKTSSGETLVKDLGPGVTYGHVVSDNVMYFAFGPGYNTNQQKVWRTDGTTAGTYQVGEIEGSEWSGMHVNHLMVLDHQVYFSSENATGGTALFRATQGETIAKIADMPRVSTSTVVNDHLLMFAGVGDQTEVYSTNGTPAGTQLLTTLATPSYYQWIQSAVVGEYAYFSGLREDTNFLWRTNGTPCGTYPVYTGASEHFGIVALDNHIVFGGFTNKTGNEPHIYRNINSLGGAAPCVESASVTSMTAIGSMEEKRVDLAYPNPFTNSFTFKLEDQSTSEIEVGVYTIYGMPVETVKNMKANTDYDLGSAWPKGSYIIKVKTGDRTITHQVIKK